MRYRPKHTTRNKPHFSAWIMQIAAVLGCLTVISAYLLSGVYAKFFTSASGSDSARVAKFSVSAFAAAGQKNDFTLSADGNNTAEYSFTVTSDSEVSVKYDVILELPEALPVGVTISITVDEKECTSNDGKRYTFSDVGQIMANDAEKTNTHDLVIVVSASDQPFTLNNIKVTVVASQID